MRLGGTLQSMVHCPFTNSVMHLRRKDLRAKGSSNEIPQLSKFSLAGRKRETVRGGMWTLIDGMRLLNARDVICM